MSRHLSPEKRKHEAPPAKSRRSVPSYIIIIVLLAVLSAAAVLCVKLFGATLRPAPTPIPRVTQTAEPAEASVPAASSEPVTSAEPVEAELPYSTPVLPPVKDVRISEVMAENRAVVRDADGDFPGWFELVNRSGAKLSLKGWGISDGESDWALPDVTLADGEYLLVFASGKDRRGDEIHTCFTLSDSKTLVLSDAYGRAVDSAALTGSKPNLSLIKTDDGSYVPCSYPTPGGENSEQEYEMEQNSAATPSPLIIYEVMTSSGMYFGQGADSYGIIELKNVADYPVKLSNYYLSNDAGDLKLWRLPEQTLAPGAIVTVLCVGGKNAPVKSKMIPANFDLDAESDELFLSNAYKLIDYAPLHDIGSGGSFGRMDGENGFFYFETPTPRAKNTGGVRLPSPDQGS